MNKQLIFHIDVNSAFLSWSALDELEKGSKMDLRLVPSIVGGDMSKRHGVVLAKSIPAKAYGITTGEPVANAFRKCPGLITVAPNHDLYHRQSSLLMKYLSEICPDIEQVSIDECYMDFSPIAANYTSPEEAAAAIKNGIFDRFRFTVNIGISDKKVLAKMASDFQKPNLVHTLYSWEIREKLWPLPVSSLFLCGHSSVDTLKKLGILTIGDLAAADPGILEAHLKSHGLTLWKYANGQDASTVAPLPSEAKGIGNSTTLSADVTSRDEAARVLLSLSESVGERLRASHFKAGLVCTEIKYNTFRSVSHQALLTLPSSSTDIIYRQALALFDELWDGTPIRLLGIRSSKLSDEGAPEQLSLFDNPPPVSAKQQKLDALFDDIRKKYGANSITRASLLPKK